MSLKAKFFGTNSSRELRKIRPIVDKIESLKSSMQKLSDVDLKHKTVEFKNRLSHGESLDSILPYAFAVVREASRRVLGLEHYRVQLIGGIVLYHCQIAEMSTGEGKTLVAALPSYLMALTGNGVHVVTVNDYLAKRDAEEIGQIHNFLGLTTGCVLSDMDHDLRKMAYDCDITYITNNELGFDYLRDNMVVKREHRVQRGLHYCIIDEVDSILIDEARTPLIISGQASESNGLYVLANSFFHMLKRGSSSELSKIERMAGEVVTESGDYVVDEKDKFVHLTEQGVQKAEKFFKLDNLADPSNLSIQHHIQAALRANTLMFRDKDYVVKDGEVLIVDEFTGRIMPGRRYSDGLHQAIEAKESVDIRYESKTLATITLQNFFNKYEKKSGMTGTASTEELEFKDIYQMKVVTIPTNRPVIREDLEDVVYLTKKAKYQAITDKVIGLYQKRQPVLVGTVSIEVSEILSSLFRQHQIPHQVLNAKFHEMEAEIVAHAGEAGMVTIATNMAGRGTDIKLDDEARNHGGLFIIGTERHESRRIDNQLRGRSGRQGDVGTSQFFVSLEDDVLRLFGSQSMLRLFQSMGLDESSPVTEKGVSKSILRAQKRIEGNHFSVRKNLTDFDAVNNEQRELIYADRRVVLEDDSVSDFIQVMLESLVQELVDDVWSNTDSVSYENLKLLSSKWRDIFDTQLVLDMAVPDGLSEKEKKGVMLNRLVHIAKGMYQAREIELSSEVLCEAERMVLLRCIDMAWMQHVDDLEHIRQGIGLVGYAQRDPVVEYRTQAFDAFDKMLERIRYDVVKTLFHVRLQNVESA